MKEKESSCGCRTLGLYITPCFFSPFLQTAEPEAAGYNVGEQLNMQPTPPPPPLSLHSTETQENTGPLSLYKEILRCGHNLPSDVFFPLLRSPTKKNAWCPQPQYLHCRWIRIWVKSLQCGQKW